MSASDQDGSPHPNGFRFDSAVGKLERIQGRAGPLNGRSRGDRDDGLPEVLAQVPDGAPFINTVGRMFAVFLNAAQGGGEVAITRSEHAKPEAEIDIQRHCREVDKPTDPKEDNRSPRKGQP